MAFSAEFFYYARPPLVVQNWVNAASVLPIGGVDPLAPHPCGAWQHDSAGNWTSPRYLTSYRIAGEGSQGHDPDGAPTLTYPIQFTVANGSSAYHGTITLRWNGLFGGGWQVESGETDC